MRLPSRRRSLRLLSVFAFLALVHQPGVSPAEEAAASLTGAEIAHEINQRNFGRSVRHRMRMELIREAGKVRVRELKSFRKFEADASYLVFYAIDPVEYRYTAYLVHDYFDPDKQDDQWLYRPREKRSQRVAATARREAFLGSDFTIDDIKKIFRIELQEYEWERKGEGEVNGRPVVLVEQRPVTKELAKNLGVSRILNYVDPQSWQRLKVEYWDPSGEALKVLSLDTRGSGEPGIAMRNLQSQHETVLTFLESSYDEELDDELFSLRGIEREAVR